MLLHILNLHAADMNDDRDTHNTTLAACLKAPFIGVKNSVKGLADVIRHPVDHLAVPIVRAVDFAATLHCDGNRAMAQAMLHPSQNDE